jgi:hypothetical protein
MTSDSSFDSRVDKINHDQLKNKYGNKANSERIEYSSAYFFMYRKVCKNNIKTLNDDIIPQIITELLSKEESDVILKNEEREREREKMRNSIYPSV